MNSFFMQQQKLLDPEAYESLVASSNNSPCARRVECFIDSYRADPIFLEQAATTENQIRDNILTKVKLPQFAREEILN